MSGGAEPPAAYVCFDLEATGLSPKTDRVIEIGAVRLDAQLRRQAELELVVDPGIPIPLAIQRLVGLRDGDVRGAPSPVEGMAQLAELAEGAALITHGGVFDMHFCRELLPGEFANRLVLDTLDLARILLPAVESHGLQALSRMAGLAHDRPHRALSDAQATADLFALLCHRAETLPTRTLQAAREVAGRLDGPLGVFFGAVVRGVGTPAVAPLSAGTGAAPRQAAPAAAATLNGAHQSAAARGRGEADLALDEASALLLGTAPASADASFEYREEQVQMGRAVAQALERRRRVLVEAPTGVGKSRGYLMPLALWTGRTGERAVVATHTVNLQEQLVDRDVAAVAQLTGSPVRVALLKGRNHYISLRRWQRFLGRPDEGPAREALEAVRFKLKVLVWLTETRSGDRSELHLVAEEERLWREVASDTDDCLGTLCVNWATRSCHMVAARVAAQEAAIVVTNHALLLAASESQGQVLPAHAALIIDEAHHLEEAATQQLGATLRGADITFQLERIVARPRTQLADAVERCHDATARLFGDVKGLVGELLGGEHAGNGRAGLSAALRDDARFAVLVRAGRYAVDALTGAAQTLEQLHQAAALQGELIGGPGSVPDDLMLTAGGLTQQASVIRRVLLEPQDGFVSWLELRAEQAELHEAPVSVAEPLRHLVFEQVDAAVLTSATLAVGDSFDFIRRRVGIGDAADELVLASPFDYLRQALCVLAESLPAYDDPAHDTAMAVLVAGIAERLGGRTLVLFTGYGPLRRVHALLHDRLHARRIALLGQGLDGTRRQILNSFLADSRTVLLGTNSFWEGIDVPGERLQCVVIDKLPFAVPTDPLVRARTEGLRDPFTQYILPAAVIRLRQGFGRLIRRASDRGAVVLCDDRLATRSYADAFLSALPPATMARAAAEEIPMLVERFVREGAAPGAVGESGRA